MIGMNHTDIVLIFCTAPSGEAEEIAKRLIEERLAACVNITPVRSVYRWDGEVVCDDEQLLIVKTTAEASRDCIQRIEAIHSYDVPEILSIPVPEGNQPYLDWVQTEVGG
ncbi:divalent-cation tolerance protein CutA [Methanocalculus taiwanensis]|nr:divalent-cation tolerance protein CutA [Methanocalculus taiwanensis]